MSPECMEPLQPPAELTVYGARFPDGHDPFWPRIELSVLRERLRLGDQVSDVRLALAARCAAVTAASEFARWRAVLRGRGYKRLEDVAGHHHGRALSVCYRRFVEAAVMRTLYTDSCGQVVRRTLS
ncbi:head completion/stabilization protein [Pseudomonas sp. Teo4]|uniref:head completion/stabilization protein n=1 Tax=Pseudomonas sp. Teo4 TaxID=3064528 RepID=UPI002ABA46C0|nr:head completion/stabilization protein [Pseudomonas sp. Teo4]MDZ3992830.1 hypothetical protein [Pseudomonas sp. Teo4]